MIAGRRTILAVAGGTLAAATLPRKPLAAELPPVSAGLRPVDPPEPSPEEPFLTPDGAQHHLSDFQGRGMVVNLWATWCGPCVAEMPSLQALSRALAPKDIAVLPLSSDRGGAEAVSAWYQAHGIADLPVLLDPKGAIARAVQARGIPTTIIINTKGRVVARLEGGADWGSTQAQALVAKLASG